MAVWLNKIMVIGNLGTDPEMRYTPRGTPVTTFRLATNRISKTENGEKTSETEWFTVVAWDRLGEQVNQYLSKGRRAYVEGRFRSRSWEGQDGQTRSVNEIVANSVLFLDQVGSSEEPPQSAVPSDDSDDLPF